MLRCLLEGVRRQDARTAEQISQRNDSFVLADWNYQFYGEYHDIAVDLPGIKQVLAQTGPNKEDVADVTSLKRRAILAIYRAIDRLPFLVPRLANDKVEIHLRDFRRYVTNEGGVADAAQRLLRELLLNAEADGRPTLLIGHSMGSVIAWDVLWKMTHELNPDFALDTFLTLGSPLGQKYIQMHLSGHGQRGAKRYPANIGHWTNVAAVGELTATDTRLANDFGEMVSLGLVNEIDDWESFNYLRDGGDGGGLNVHSEYGYLVNSVVAGIIADWWKSVMPGSARDKELKKDTVQV